LRSLNSQGAVFSNNFSPAHRNTKFASNFVDSGPAVATICQAIAASHAADESRRSMRQLININPTSVHGVYLRLIVSNGAGL
jgi:hypothetical protein